MSAAGSDTSPYDTWAKAATTIANINALNPAAGTHIINIRPGDSFTDTTLDLVSWSNAGSSTVTIQGLDGDGKTIASDGRPWLNPNSIGAPAIILDEDDDADLTGLNITIKDIDVSGQDYQTTTQKATIQIDGLGNVTLDGIYADGSTGISDPYTKYKSVIGLYGSSGTVEIKNCVLTKYGESGTWATPSSFTQETGDDPNGFFIGGVGGISAGTLSIHDNTISYMEADCIAMENVTAITNVYDNTITNCGENAIDLKSAQNINFYRNTVYRAANFTGVGGSDQPSGTPITEGLISIIGYSAIANDGNEIYDNDLGPSDTAAFKVGANASTGGVNNLEIRFNRITEVVRGLHLWSGGGAAQSDVRNVHIFGNVFRNMKSGDFIATYNIGGSATPGDEIVIYNNSYYNANAITDGTTANRLIAVNSATDSILFKNNAIHINDSDAYYVYKSDCSDRCGFDTNQWYNEADTPAAQWYSGGSIALAAWNALSFVGTDAEGDPLFTSSSDLTLQAGSPCLNNADGTYTLLDPDSVWPNGVITMLGNEIGSFGYEDSPPIGGDTGLYGVIGESKTVTLDGTKTLTLSGE